jgi:hypothetical protein
LSKENNQKDKKIGEVEAELIINQSKLERSSSEADRYWSESQLKS